MSPVEVERSRPVVLVGWEIADRLFVSKKTIDKLFWKLYQRTGCRNFFELYAEFTKNDSSGFQALGSEDPFPATNSFR